MTRLTIDRLDEERAASGGIQSTEGSLNVAKIHDYRLGRVVVEGQPETRMKSDGYLPDTSDST
jgi:hypothetical protein